MLLTNEERQKFIAWLEQAIVTSEGIESQIPKIGVPILVANFLIKNEKIEREAYKTVLTILKATESQKL